MSQVITELDQLTPAWLTDVLRADGRLPQGSVTTIEETKTRHMISRNHFLNVAYTPDVPTDAPRTMFFKMSHPDKQPLNATEVEFYNRIAAAMPDPPIPHCYNAEFDPAAGSYHILLQDLSATHTDNEFPLPARIPHAEQMVNSLAELHAFWWDSPRLNGDIAQPAAQQIPLYYSHNVVGLPRMIDLMGDRLPTARRQLLEQVFATHEPVMLHRAAQPHQTLIHSDAHTGNFLLPRAIHTGRAYMVDRQLFDWGLHAWVGVSDLTYLWCHWWHPDRRRLLEVPLLHRYHARLQALGVTGYDWDALWLDYRLAAIQGLHVAVEWCVDDGMYGMAGIWYQQLLNALVAFDDLDCMELLQ